MNLIYTYYYLTGINGEVFYVGKTEAGVVNRLISHKNEARSGSYNPDKDALILKHWEFLKINEIESVECSMAESAKIEMYWIQQFQAWGFKLCNRVFLCKYRIKKIPVKKKAILISEELYNEFNEFCKERHIILRMAIEDGLRSKLHSMRKREKTLKIA